MLLNTMSACWLECCQGGSPRCMTGNTCISCHCSKPLHWRPSTRAFPQAARLFASHAGAFGVGADLRARLGGAGASEGTRQDLPPPRSRAGSARLQIGEEAVRRSLWSCLLAVQPHKSCISHHLTTVCTNWDNSPQRFQEQIPVKYRHHTIACLLPRYGWGTGLHYVLFVRVKQVPGLLKARGLFGGIPALSAPSMGSSLAAELAASLAPAWPPGEHGTPLSLLC